MEKMSITKALAELKLLDEKVKRKSSARFCNIVKGNDSTTVNNPEDVSKYSENIKSVYQSIRDMMSRRSLIKSKIMMSNSNTHVVIGGKKMLVIDAIEKKSSIVYENDLLKRLTIQYTNALKSIEESNLKIEEQINNMLRDNLSKDRIAKKDDYESIAGPFREGNKYSLVDPIGIKKEIDNLTEHIENFESEVDFVLSESNAKTVIEL